MHYQFVGVFGGSNPTGTWAEFNLKLAFDLGVALAEAGFSLTNGGGDGMMGAVSAGAHSKGAHVHLVCLTQFPPSHCHYTTREHRPLLTDRQFRLISFSPAWVALPGGIGTIFEILEILAKKTVGEIPNDYPIICLGHDYILLNELLVQQVERGMIKEEYLQSLYFVKTIKETIRVLMTHYPKGFALPLEALKALEDQLPAGN